MKTTTKTKNECHTALQDSPHCAPSYIVIMPILYAVRGNNAWEKQSVAISGSAVHTFTD